MKLRTHRLNHYLTQPGVLWTLVAGWSFLLLLGFTLSAGAQTADDSSAAAPANAADSSYDLPAPSSEAAAGVDDPSDGAPDSPGPGAASPNDVSDADNGQTLEVPQVVDPNSLTRQDSGNSAQESQQASGGASEEDDQTADNQASEAQPGPVGTIQDYENQASEPSYGAVAFAPGAVMVPSSAYRPLNMRPIGPGPFITGGMIAAPPIILPPTSAGALISTSPMLMPAPRTFARPGGWWMRTR